MIDHKTKVIPSFFRFWERMSLAGSVFGLTGFVLLFSYNVPLWVIFLSALLFSLSDRCDQHKIRLKGEIQ